ncbi:MAG: hypothetical protein JWO81_2923 [Alphaproteobacteria bacterium]|nr:hypothetical protein [Alphaproteobacteria bacterium]
MTRDRKEHLFAWAALAAGATAWFVSQQAGSDLSFAHCHASGALPVIVIGLLALALIGVGGLYSHRVWDRGTSEETGKSFIALLGMLVAGLLAIAIVYQSVAALIIPRCFA